MKKNYVKQLESPRVFIHHTPTASSLFHATLKVSARMCVLKHLGITKTILHDMGVMELKTLLSLLHDATSLATEELSRRG